MPTYEYKVRDKHGRAITGVMDGSSENDVIESLKKMGYVPISVKEKKQKKNLFHIELFSNVKDEDIALFTRQIHTLLKAGVPLLMGLESTGEQANSKALKDIISKVRSEVEAGMNFSEALSRFPRTFSPLYVNMVKAGEASGTLDEIMKRIADMVEYDMDIKAKIKSATRYPMLALLTLFGAFFVIVLFVIPRFAAFFGQFDIELPLITRMLLETYRIMHDYWHLVLIVLAGIVVGFVKLVHTPFGKAKWDMLKLKVPIFGPIIFKLSMSRFAKTTSILITSGVSMLQTLALTAETVGNVIIARAIIDIKEGVNEGKGMAEPMRVSKLFTPIVIQMVSIGEETGKLDELLNETAEHYDQQVNYAMKNLTTMIEPILIFVLGIMVLFVALAIFLPMWNMVQIISR